MRCPIRRIRRPSRARSCAGPSSRARRHERLHAWHRDLIRLRRSTPAFTDGRLDGVRAVADEARSTLTVARGDWVVACNLAPARQSIALAGGGRWSVALVSEADARLADAALEMGPRASRSCTGKRRREGLAGSPSLSAPPGTARASTSRCSPSTRPASSSASSTAASRRRRETARIPLAEHTDQVWHGYLPERGPASSTATGCTGRTSPPTGHRFNPAQAAARSVRQGDRRARRLERRRSSATAIGDPEARSRRWTSATARPACPRRWSSTTLRLGRRPAAADARGTRRVIYEAHVKGFTMRHPECRRTLRGTYAGLAVAGGDRVPAALGVTAVELLPVHHFVDDQHLVEQRAARTTGATTRSASSRRTRATPQRATAASRSASSRRWSRRCTRRASR